jgi:hypothetical protein
MQNCTVSPRLQSGIIKLISTCLLQPFIYKNTLVSETMEYIELPPPRNLLHAFEAAIPVVEEPHCHQVNDIVVQKKTLLENPVVECPICIECQPLQSCVTAPCGHHTCSACMNIYLQLQQESQCPPTCAWCRESITTLTTYNDSVHGDYQEYLHRINTMPDLTWMQNISTVDPHNPLVRRIYRFPDILTQDYEPYSDSDTEEFPEHL